MKKSGEIRQLVIRQLDETGRICIPKKIVKELQLEPREPVKVMLVKHNNGQKTIIIEKMPDEGCKNEKK